MFISAGHFASGAHNKDYLYKKENLNMAGLPADLGVAELAIEPQLAEVVSIDPEVDFKEFKFGDEDKIISYLGMSEVIAGRHWRTALRLGGDHLIVGGCDDKMDELYERAMLSSEEHPSFYINLETDVADTLAIRGVNPIDHRGIMDFVRLQPPTPRTGETRSMIVQLRDQPRVNPLARAYTRQVLKLAIPLI